MYVYKLLVDVQTQTYMAYRHARSRSKHSFLSVIVVAISSVSNLLAASCPTTHSP